MKFKILLCVLLLSPFYLLAQNQLLPCNCDALKTSQKKYFENEQQADSLLHSYLQRLWQYSKIKKISDPFVIREAFCETPLSEICPDYLPDGSKVFVRLILYNDYFLKRLNTRKNELTLVDKHVLLHELGHHVLGHHKNSKSIEALQIPYQQSTPNPKLWQKYGASNPMAQELEADIYAVWALSRLDPNFSVDKLIEELNKEIIEGLDKKMVISKHSDHPLFKDRIETMRKFKSQLPSANKSVPRKYFSDIASSAYLDLWPQSYVYDLSLVAGTSVTAATQFKVNGKKIDAFLYPFKELANYHVGLSLDCFRWDRPWQTGLEIDWSQHKYGTTVDVNNTNKLTETLKTNYVTLSPKLTWNSIGSGKLQSLQTLRIGFLAGIAINVRMPVGNLDYVNYVSNAAAPTALFSVSPKITAGMAFMRKSFLPRGFKVLFSYDPQWIRLRTNTDIVAISHNLECTLQFSIKRW